jgi:hypothetical protein
MLGSSSVLPCARLGDSLESFSGNFTVKTSVELNVPHGIAVEFVVALAQCFSANRVSGRPRLCTLISTYFIHHD